MKPPAVLLLGLALLLAAAPARSRPVNRSSLAGQSNDRRFSIWKDQFLKDGRPFRFISGSIHYHRIPPEYWRDRLQRLQGLGLNAVQMYVPWNWHEQRSGQYDFEGWRNVTAFLDIAHELGLLVLLRPGPFICAEWEFGGLPAWLLSDEAVANATQALQHGTNALSAADISAAVAKAAEATDSVSALAAVAGSGAAAEALRQAGAFERSPEQQLRGDPAAGPIVLRSSDPRFLHYVDRWFGQLLPLLAPYTYERGGPIAMLQVENEYGYYGSDKVYLRHLVGLARHYLGSQLLLYTTDGAANEEVVRRGTLEGPDVVTIVDFGASQDLQRAFGTQRLFNPPGASPPMCSEFYIGWLTHWGEGMANTSAAFEAGALRKLLAFAGGTASVNLYMAHGGTNFGFWAGANMFGLTPRLSAYQGHITSYDYDCPVGEAGTSGQLGIGGEDKYAALRAVILEQAAKPAAAAAAARSSSQVTAASRRSLAAAGPDEPPVPAPPRLAAYGRLALSERADLLRNLVALVPEGSARSSDWPAPMEQHSQSFGLALYSTQLSAGPGGLWGQAGWWGHQETGSRGQAPADAAQYLSFSARDYARVLLGGEPIGTYWRNDPLPVPLPLARGAALQLQGNEPTRSSRPQRSRRGAGTSSLGTGTGPRRQPQPQAELQVLVEAMGRNNFAFGFGGFPDPKGLLGNVSLGERALHGWQVQPLELRYSQLAGLAWQPLGAAQAGSGACSLPQQAPRMCGAEALQALQAAQLLLPGGAAAGAAAAAEQQLAAAAGRGSPGQQQQQQQVLASCFRPSFYRGFFNITASSSPDRTGSSPSGPAAAARTDEAHPEDTFLLLDGWDKGYVWVNGHNLGRYWQSQGPQRSLYLPGAWLRSDAPNELLLLELSAEPEQRSFEVLSVAQPRFGK